MLEYFDYPLTGERVRVQHFKTSRGSIVYAPEGVYALPAGGSPSGFRSEQEKPFRLGHHRAGDHLWITYDERFQINDDAGELLYADSSLYRYMTRLADMQDTSSTGADAVMTWSTETRFWPWMNMPGHPGHLMFGSMGRKFSSLAELPTGMVAAAEAIHPGHLTDHIRWNEYRLP